MPSVERRSFHRVQPVSRWLTLEQLHPVERAVSILRWSGLAFGVVQALVFRTFEHPSAWALFALFGAADLAGTAVRRRLSTDRQARMFSLASWTIDAVFVASLVWAIAGPRNVTAWLLLILLPTEGAVRHLAVGAFAGWVVASGIYLGVYSATLEGIELTGGRLTFRMGIFLLFGLFVAGMERRNRRQLAALQRTDRWRSRLIGSLGHDVRGSLGSIALLAEVLEEDDRLDVEKQRQFGSLIRQQALRLTSLSEGLLDLAQLDAGMFVLEPTTFDPHDVVADVVEQSSRPDEVTVEIPDGLLIHADPGRFSQIVANLVSNALKYGRPPVLVRMEANDEGIVLEVSDHGEGIPGELRSAMLEAFARGGQPGSVGLGLWIVGQLTQAHGGSVAYEDAPDGGALLRVTFPQP